MSEEVAAVHRSVQIQQILKFTPDQIHKIWSTLAQPSVSTIAVSNACHKVYHHVVQRNLDLINTLQNLQNLVFITKEKSKLVIFLRTISRLLIFSIEEQKQWVLTSSPSGTIHPYVSILRKIPSLYNDILYEVDYMLSVHQSVENSKLMEMLYPLFDAVFLIDDIANPDSLLTRLQSILLVLTDSKDTAGELPQLILSYLWECLDRFPTSDDPSSYFAVLDVLIHVLSSVGSIAFLSDSDLFSLSNNLVYLILDRLLDASSRTLPTMPYLFRLERILGMSFSDKQSLMAQPNFDMLWTSLSFVLLKAQTLDDQQLIIRLLNHLGLTNRSRLILRVAYIPLFQTFSEMMDMTSNQHVESMKRAILDLISMLNDVSTADVNGENQIMALKEIVGNNNINGLLAHILMFIIQAYSKQPSVLLEQLNADTGNISSLLSMLFATPYVCEDTTSRNEFSEIIVRLSSTQTVSYKFPVLLFFLQVLRRSSYSSNITLCILHRILPDLVQVNDPVTTSKVLQIVLNIIGSNSNNTMSSIGVKMLAAIYQRQPRVWQELKKALAEWVLHRKSVTFHRKVDLSVTGPIKMELVVLTTMRDLCLTRPRQCASDIFPMIISLLQTCRDLSMASIAIMMHIICICVREDLTEPRSVWNVAVMYIADFAMEVGVTKSMLVIEQLCKFYAIAGQKDDGSEHYLLFKQNILNDYIVPLLDTSGLSSAATQYALEALSHFPANEITTILPERSKDFISQIVKDGYSEYEPVLVKLLSHELDHMRRGLYKEANPKNTEPVEKKVAKNSSGDLETRMCELFIKRWEDGHVAPGLRSGYTFTILSNPLMFKGAYNAKSVTEFTKSKWYQFMISSFTDITLTDHLLVRISGIKTWESFFKSILAGNEANIEILVSSLLKDLLSRLERSTVPGTTSNILFAITGLVHTVRLIIPSYAVNCATQVIDILMTNYIALSTSPLSHSAHLMSEEVQFSSRFALGHLAASVIGNEKLIKTVLNDSLVSVINDGTKSRQLDTSVDLVQFANGYSAGYLTSALASWPTKTDSIENLGKQSIYDLLEYCNRNVSNNVMESRLLGIMMGWASNLNTDMMQEVYWFAQDIITAYVNGASHTNKGILFGSLWICSVGAVSDEEKIDEKVIRLLKDAVGKASAQRELDQHYYHFAVSYSQLIRTRFLINNQDETEASSSYSQLFNTELDNLKNDDPSSHYRMSSIFSLGCLLGVVYIGTGNNTTDRLYVENKKYDANTRKPIIHILESIVGLTGKPSSFGNLKSARIAAAVCGMIIEKAFSVQFATNSSHSEMSDRSNILLTASSEPTSYNRLNNVSSYLRALFDTLVDLTERNMNHTSIGLLLSTLQHTPGPLPAVNWFNLLNKISKMSKKLRVISIEFASAHATTSLSLTEYILLQLSDTFDPKRSVVVDEEMGLLLTGEIGIGKMFELAGLPSLSGMDHQKRKRRGVDAVVSRTLISEARAIEMIELYCTRFEEMDQNQKYHFVLTVKDHLPTGSLDENKSKLIMSIRNIILKKITLKLIQEGKEDSLYEDIVRKSVSCSVKTIQDLLINQNMKYWLFDNMQRSLLGKLIAVSEMCLQMNDNTAKLITEIITHLLMASESVSAVCWGIVSKTIRMNVKNEQEKLAWVVRILDAFIVVAGQINADNVNVLQIGITYGLRYMLSILCWNSVMDSVDDIDMIDTCYMLTYLIDIGKDYNNEQQQIVKRVFKMIELLELMDDPSKDILEFYLQVIRTCPYEAIANYQPQYIKLIPM
ncbi:hypothetical protein BDB01DRAFT_831946 [Pilobolus umbonatus]|nr:hypothetical protein BDB01DRAFT_831946 [Pilobolus umbonatus]